MRQQTPVFSQSQFDPEYGRPVRVREFERPMMSDEVETGQTIAYMEELACFDAGERHVIDAANQALSDAGIDQTADPFRKACAIFWWLKRHIRYVPTPATSALVDQTLIAPSALLQMPDPHGDCPQFSMLAAAMCRICCVPCFFKTIAADPKYPTIYSHVYNAVEVAGSLMPFDSSNGPEPGAEYAIACKSKVWPRTIPDHCKAKGKPMLRPTRQASGFRNAALRGALGDASGYDPSTDYSVLVAPTVPDLSTAQIDAGYQSNLATEQAAANATIASLAPSLGPASSGSGFLSTLANDLTSIARPLVNSAAAKPYYITGPNGQQVLYNPATGQVMGGIGGSLSSISGTGWLLILGVLGVVVLSRR